jgi:putative membrane protein
MTQPSTPVHPRVERLFSEAEIAAVEAAVEAAEQRTAAEIVPWVVASSDPYAEVPWKGAIVGLLGALALCGLLWWLPEWTVVGPGLALGAPLAGAAGGYLGVRWLQPWRRWLAGSDVLDQRVRGRAAEAFLDAQVFATESRTGILIFISLFERRCLVLPDLGAAKLDEAFWTEAASRVAKGVRSGEAATALVEVIERFATLLSEAGLAIQHEDVNELPDRLRFEEP